MNIRMNRESSTYGMNMPNPSLLTINKWKKEKFFISSLLSLKFPITHTSWCASSNMEMSEFNSIFPVTLAFVILVTWACKIVNWIYLQPKKLEQQLRGPGLKGNPYRLFHGDLKDIQTITTQAQSKAINLREDILSHVITFDRHIVQMYGKLVKYTGANKYFHFDERYFDLNN